MTKKIEKNYSMTGSERIKFNLINYYEENYFSFFYYFSDDDLQKIIHLI